MDTTPDDPIEKFRAQAMESLHFLLGGMSANGESWLLGMTKRATTRAEQAEYHDAVREFRLKWGAVERRFLADVDAALLALRSLAHSGAEASPKPATAPAPFRPDALAGLDMVDDSLMDQEIAVGNVAGQASLEHREVIMSLGLQVAAALGLRRPVTELPISPKALTSAFMGACGQAEVPPKVRVTLARLFARLVLGELGPVYGECLTIFPADAAATNAPAAPRRPEEQPEALRAVELPTAIIGVEPERGRVPAAAASAPQEAIWDSERLPMLAPPGKAMAMPRNLVDDLLHDIQDDLLDPDAITVVMTSRMPLQPLDVLQLLNDSLKSAGQTRVMALPVEVIEVIGLVRAFFDHVTRQDSVPMPIRRLTGLLQIPFLRCALREPGTLTDALHPLRVLLSDLARAGSAWRPDGGVASEDLLRLIQVLVSRVLGDYDKDNAVFTTALADLHRFEDMQAGRPVRPSAAGGSAPTAQSAVIRPVRPPASSEFVQLVDKLAPDSWVELRPPGEERKRIQFVARMPRTGMCSFIDASGQRAGEWSRNDLAHMIETGEAVILRGQGGADPAGRPGRR